MTSFLDRLLDSARRRVEDDRAARPFNEVRAEAEHKPAPPSFRDALAIPGVSVIAEVKRASPSKGDLAPGISAIAQAGHYLAGGVHAISVLTEPVQFKGSLRDLQDASALGVPTIRKDFVVDPYQIWEARAAGASAVLLIVAALTDERLEHLYAEATTAGLDVLVEVHDDDELRRASAIRPAIIGVNARDLRTFHVDRQAFERLRPSFPAEALAVAESGIRGPEDVVRAGTEGADAVLVGETLVTSDDPAAMAAALVAAGRPTAPSTTADTTDTTESTSSTEAVS